MEGPGQLQVSIIGPACDSRHDRTAIVAVLDQQSPEPRLERQMGGVGAKKRMTPPATRVASEGVEDLGPRRRERHVERHIDAGLLEGHTDGCRLGPSLEPKQPGCPGLRLSLDPSLMNPLKRNRIEVVPALAPALATRDEAGRRKHIEMAHDRDSGDLEMRRDVARDAGSLAK